MWDFHVTDRHRPELRGTKVEIASLPGEKIVRVSAVHVLTGLCPTRDFGEMSRDSVGLSCAAASSLGGAGGLRWLLIRLVRQSKHRNECKETKSGTGEVLTGGQGSVLVRFSFLLTGRCEQLHSINDESGTCSWSN